MKIQEIFALYEKGDLAAAMGELSARLNENPDDCEALFVTGQCYLRMERNGLAAAMFRRIVAIEPANHSAWNNLGHCFHEMQKYMEASRFFVESLKAGGYRFAPLGNLLLMHLNLGDVEMSKRLFRLARYHCETPQDVQDCLGNVSLALLATREWGMGWDAYESLIRPNKLRKETKYEPDLPMWDGSPGGEVVVYGEQGIGDELLFASCIPDAMQSCSVVIDCDPRLMVLFRRSFPGATVYGTRATADKPWLKNHAPKAKIGIGSLPKFYRRDEASFPGRPYLVPDPEKRAMARALLDQWPGRKIGLAWTGGTKSTRQDDRSLTLEQLEPILNIPNATFISLAYNGDYYATPDQRIKHVPIFTQSKDYGDTAALVAELDVVVTVTTAVALLAGAVGTPCHVLVPEFPTWHWPRSGEFPWFPLTLHRRHGGPGTWADCLVAVRDELKRSLGGMVEAQAAQ